MRSPMYEITFMGEAGRMTRAEFDDCEVIVGSGSTTLRAELPDQGALWGLVQRIISLGLIVTDLHLVTPPPLP
jgi:hypothetical protein